jgi:hypothetical protein
VDSISTVSALGGASGRVHQQVIGPPQVAREQDPVPAHFQQQAGRAQDVPGV